MAGVLEGLPIVDADFGMTLNVQKRDIKKQGIKDAAHCALAECAMRQNHYQEARVYISRAYVKSLDGTHWVRYVVTPAAQREITAYDRGAAFQPGSYRLEAPYASAKQGYKKPGSSVTAGSGTTGTKRIAQVTANIRPRAPTITNGKLENAKWSGDREEV